MVFFIQVLQACLLSFILPVHSPGDCPIYTLQNEHNGTEKPRKALKLFQLFLII